MKAKHCTFKNAIVRVDGHAYRSCRFERCRLVYAGGDLPSMIDCTFDGCSWRLVGAAGRTLRLLQAMIGRGGATRAQVERALGLTTASALPERAATAPGLAEQRRLDKNLH